MADILWGIQNDTGSSLTIACINEVAYVIGACDSFLEQDPKKDVLPYWSAFVGASVLFVSGINYLYWQHNSNESLQKVLSLLGLDIPTIAKLYVATGDGAVLSNHSWHPPIEWHHCSGTPEHHPNTQS